MPPPLPEPPTLKTTNPIRNERARNTNTHFAWLRIRVKKRVSSMAARSLSRRGRWSQHAPSRCGRGVDQLVPFESSSLVPCLAVDEGSQDALGAAAVHDGGRRILPW